MLDILLAAPHDFDRSLDLLGDEKTRLQPAAESAIGLAILVVLFRERRTINVEDLDTLKG